MTKGKSNLANMRSNAAMHELLLLVPNKVLTLAISKLVFSDLTPHMHYLH